LKTRPIAATFIAAFTLLGVALAAAPRQSSSANEGKPVEITIDNFTFAPASVQIAAGTKVTWTNKDDVPHTVVSDDQKTFKSKALDTDDQFSFTFAQSGTYKYFCSVHPKMTGEIIVK
jgi:plastocyanin